MIDIKFHLKKHNLEDLNICEMDQSIGTLIGYFEQTENNLQKIIPPEFFNILSEPILNGYVVQRAYVPISKAQINGIFTSIRTQILDLVFAIENEFNETEMENLFHSPTKVQQDKINPIINKFIQNNFYSYGESTQNTKIELETDK